MTIEIIKGDLITAFKTNEVNVIAHQCNMQANMGKGLAKQIAEEFPEAAQADNAWFKNGDYSTLFSRAHTKYGTIYNLYGQRYYGTYGDFYKVTGRQTDYNLLKGALKTMSLICDPKLALIGFPYKMSSGLAGGDWNTVLNYIETLFKDFHVTIYEL